jgi:hypothetical protein
MCPRIVSYTGTCEYRVVGIGPSNLFPPNGEEYFRKLKKCPYCSGQSRSGCLRITERGKLMNHTLVELHLALALS